MAEVRAASARAIETAPEPTPEPVTPQRTVWDDLADCETGEWIDGGRDFVEGSARWQAVGGTYSGGLQFHPQTWDAYRDADAPADAHLASRAQQIVVAQRVLDEQGWGAWPACARKLGLR